MGIRWLIIHLTLEFSFSPSRKDAMEGSDGTEMIFTADDVIALDWIHETVAALCCAASYIISTTDKWDAFQDWLTNIIAMEQGDRDFLVENSSRVAMARALMKADRLLMLVEGARALSDTELRPSWMNED